MVNNPDQVIRRRPANQGVAEAGLGVCGLTPLVITYPAGRHCYMRKLAYLAVFTLLILAAVNAAEQAKPPGQGADACAVVSRAEIEQALGVKLTDGVKNPALQTPGVVSTCNYQVSGGGQVTIAIRRRPIKYQGTATVDAKKQGVQQGHIAGLGRDALLTEASAGETSIENLSIFRGDYDFITVTFMGSSPVKPISAAIEKVGRMVLDGWK